MTRSGWFAALLVLAGVIGLTGPAAARGEQPGVFDYYVLSLSWSPTYCGSRSGRRDKQQCGAGRRFAFVVHGLWPQFVKGWPERCPTDERWVPEEQINDVLDIMPSKGLIIHEWKKHGTCSGLGQAGYFDMTRALFGKVKIPARYLSPTDEVVITPEQLVTDFVKTNRGLQPDMLSVQCGNRRDRGTLRELRVCFTRAGNLRSCGENERRRCRAEQLVLPPVRSGGS